MPGDPVRCNTEETDVGGYNHCSAVVYVVERHTEARLRLPMVAVGPGYYPGSYPAEVGPGYYPGPYLSQAPPLALPLVRLLVVQLVPLASPRVVVPPLELDPPSVAVGMLWLLSLQLTAPPLVMESSWLV